MTTTEIKCIKQLQTNIFFLQRLHYRYKFDINVLLRKLNRNGRFNVGVLFCLKGARKVILFAQLEKFLLKTSQETLITFMTMYVGVFFFSEKTFRADIFRSKTLMVVN